MQEKLNEDSNNIKKCNSKMRSAYLKLHDIEIPNKLSSKSAAIKCCKETTLKPLL